MLVVPIADKGMGLDIWFMLKRIGMPERTICPNSVCFSIGVLVGVMRLLIA
ncbi:MAG: hypothetical protein KFB97_10640 [Cyanobium sp. M30B3]|nr:MAG: hypothetical protein KFB97_10640 [Cyanobium sp. M30B3]